MTCAYCGAQLRDVRARTCSSRCRQAAYRRRKAEDGAFASLSRRGTRTTEDAIRVQLARSGQGGEPMTRSSWWLCACGQVVALKVTSCPLCAAIRPTPRLLDLMDAGLL
jgi:hypothetical protein